MTETTSEVPRSEPETEWESLDADPDRPKEWIEAACAPKRDFRTLDGRCRHCGYALCREYHEDCEGVDDCE